MEVIKLGVGWFRTHSVVPGPDMHKTCCGWSRVWLADGQGDPTRQGMFHKLPRDVIACAPLKYQQCSHSKQGLEIRLRAGFLFQTY